MKKQFQTMTLGILWGTVGCATVHLTSRVVSPPAPVYQKTAVVVHVAEEHRAKIEDAFVSELARHQKQPGRGSDGPLAEKTPEGLAEQLRARGYDSVLVVERHAMVHWSTDENAWPAVLTMDPAVTSPMGFASVDAASPHGRRFVNGRARLFDVKTGGMVWWAHGTLGMDKDERSDVGARASARAVVRRMVQEKVVSRRP